MNSREEQMNLNMELEPRIAGPVPTMVVAVVGRKESVLEDSDWLTSKLSVGFFSSVCLASRKHLLGDSGKWGIKHILLLYRQAVSLGCFPLYFCGCLLLQQVICLSGEFRCSFGLLTLVLFYWILNLVFSYRIGCIISSEVCSGFQWESSASDREEKEERKAAFATFVC